VSTPHVRAAARRRALLLLGAGAAASLALCQALDRLLAPSDPLFGTLAALPALAAAFAALHSWGQTQGARAIAPAVRRAETVVLGLLALLALVRPALGALPPQALAAAFVLLLLHRVARQTLALRPLLGHELPARPAAIFVALPFVAYLAILPYSTAQHALDGDEPYYLLVTHSLAYDGDAELTNDYRDGSWRHFLTRPLEPQPGDPRGPHGEVYSRHNELLPLFLVPFYRVGGKAGALVAMAALTALAGWLLLRLARRWFRDRPGESLLAYGLLAFSPPLLLYSYQVWVEVPAMLLGALALDRILAPPDEGTGWSNKRWLGVGLPVVLLPLLKIRFVILAAPLLVLAWLFAGRPRRPVLVLTAVLTAVAGGMMVYNTVQFGNPLKIHTWGEVQFYRQNPARHLLGFFGLFWDSAFGLFSAAPLWALTLPALALLVRKRHPLLLVLSVTALPYLFLIAPRSEWYGGWSPPFRYGLVLLPFLATALVPLLVERRGAGARFLLGALGAATVALTLVWIAMPGWTYNFADGRTYLLDALSAHFHSDVARLFPSSVRSRLATWLWPLVTLPLCIVLWRARWAGLRRARGSALAALGAAAVLVGVCATPLLARRLTTATIEFEDPWIETSGGHAEPERWRVDRTLYRAGWVLRGGESLRVPVVPGGGTLMLDVDLEWIRNKPSTIALEVRAHGRKLAEWTPRESGVWETAELGPFAWAPGDVLELAAVGPAAAEPLGGLLLDRARLRWP
jgi:hypothetical protein